MASIYDIDDDGNHNDDDDDHSDDDDDHNDTDDDFFIQFGSV